MLKCSDAFKIFVTKDPGKHRVRFRFRFRYIRPKENARFHERTRHIQLITQYVQLHYSVFIQYHDETGWKLRIRRWAKSHLRWKTLMRKICTDLQRGKEISGSFHVQIIGVLEFVNSSRLTHYWGQAVPQFCASDGEEVFAEVEFCAWNYQWHEGILVARFWLHRMIDLK